MRAALRRLGTILLFALVGVCFAPILIPPFLDRIYYQGPASGHFDGARFFNPDADPPRRSGGRIFSRLFAADERAVWPDHVPVAPTVPPRRVEGGEMRVTWIGHATVLVQTAGLNILTDPIWSDRASPVSFAGPRRVRAPGVRFEDLPKIDLVLVSHNHYDHMDLPTLRRLWARDRPLIVTSLGNDTILTRAGIPKAPVIMDAPRVPGVIALEWDRGVSVAGHEIAAWEDRPIGAAPVAYVIAERVHHWGSRWFTDRNRALWSGFTVITPAGNIFFAGDTGWGGGAWVRAAARHGPFRLAILPIGAYEPRDVMQPSHLNPEEAMRVFEILNPTQALGMHWGTFQLTWEPIDEPRQRLAAVSRRRGLAPDRFIATEAGQGFDVPLAPQEGAEAR